MVPRKSRMKSWHQRKWFFPLIAVFAVVIILGVLEATNVIHLVHQKASPSSKTSGKVRPPNSVDYSAASPGDNAANNARKSSPNPAETLDNGPTASSSSNALSVIIVNTRRSGTDVRVGNIVNGTTTGTCTLSASQAGQTAPAPVTAPVQQDVNNYDCGVMHITLPDTGTWQVNLTVTSGSHSASATSSVGAS